MKILKKHPFFNGIDFEEISREDFRGCVELVSKIKERVAEEKRKKEEAKKQKEQELMQI